MLLLSITVHYSSTPEGCICGGMRVVARWHSWKWSEDRRGICHRSNNERWVGVVTATRLLLRNLLQFQTNFSFRIRMLSALLVLACFRVRIDAVKAEARKSPRTMMRQNRLCSLNCQDFTRCPSNMSVQKRITTQNYVDVSPIVFNIFNRRTDRYEKHPLYWAETSVKTGNLQLGCTNTSATTKNLYILKFKREWTCFKQISLQDLISPQFRHRSRLAMNRRVQWNQTPPNMNDYNPECLASGAGPLQQQALPAEVPNNTPKSGAKRLNNGPGPAAKIPKVETPHEETGLVVTCFYLKTLSTQFAPSLDKHVYWVFFSILKNS